MAPLTKTDLLAGAAVLTSVVTDTIGAFEAGPTSGDTLSLLSCPILRQNGNTESKAFLVGRGNLK